MPLTDKTIRALKPQSTRKKYFDSNGLYLEVAPAGSKWWRLKYYLDGKEHRISLGTYPSVSLKEARECAAQFREQIRKGIDSGKKEPEKTALTALSMWRRNG